MATKEKLHKLVLSLSSNEKRYFKLQSQVQSGTKNYLLLFATLEKMKAGNYDRQLLLNALKIPSKDLHTAEYYLSERILESLRTFSEKKSVEAKVYNLLLNSSILEKKGFYDLSAQMLAKAKTMLKKPSSNVLIIEILKRQARHIAATETKKNEEQTDLICNELKIEVEALKEEAKYFSLNQISFVRYRNLKLAKLPAERAFIENLLENDLDQHQPNKSSFYAQYLYHSTKNNCHSLLGEFDLACAEVEKIVALWDLHPKLKADQLGLYIIQLSNLINHKNKVKDFGAAEQLLLKLETIKTNNYNERAEQFQNFYFQKLSYYLNQYEFPSAIKLVPNIDTGLKKYSNKINRARKLAFYYNIMIAYFLNADYEKVIPWLFQIKKISRVNKPRKDIQRFTRILNLVICYKIQTDRGLQVLLDMYIEEEKKVKKASSITSDIDLENMWRSINRGKSYLGKLHSFEKIVLKYFKILFETVAGREEKKVFARLKVELENLPNEQKRVLGFEEFMIWMDNTYFL